MYDKAYLDWDHDMCWKDLLNLLFKVLVCDDARTHEFHKDPYDVNEAVDHVLPWDWSVTLGQQWEVALICSDSLGRTWWLR